MFKREPLGRGILIIINSFSSADFEDCQKIKDALKEDIVFFRKSIFVQLSKSFLKP